LEHGIGCRAGDAHQRRRVDDIRDSVFQRVRSIAASGFGADAEIIGGIGIGTVFEHKHQTAATVVVMGYPLRPSGISEEFGIGIPAAADGVEVVGAASHQIDLEPVV